MGAVTAGRPLSRARILSAALLCSFAALGSLGLAETPARVKYGRTPRGGWRRSGDRRYSFRGDVYSRAKRAARSAVLLALGGHAAIGYPRRLRAKRAAAVSDRRTLPGKVGNGWETDATAFAGEGLLTAVSDIAGCVLWSQSPALPPPTTITLTSAAQTPSRRHPWDRPVCRRRSPERQ